MLEIVNDTPDPSITKEISCKHCGKTLIYTPSEVQEKEVKDYLGNLDRVVQFVTCPGCKTKVITRTIQY